MDSGDLATWFSIGVALVTVIGVVVTYLVAAGTKARRDMLEQDVTDLEKRLANRDRKIEELTRERDACLDELNALGRVVTAAAAIDRFERALAEHRAELMAALARHQEALDGHRQELFETVRGLREYLQRIYDLIMSFRPGSHRDS